MLKCSNCKYLNVEGTVFCETCGFELRNASSERMATSSRQPKEHADDLLSKQTWGAARHFPTTSLIIRIHDVEEPISVKTSPRITFGRSDQGSAIVPDVDLTPYGALENGVSRLHAVIELTQDTIMIDDAGSSNGTFLNGQKLLPHQPHILRDGDEVRLGKIIAHIYFK